MDDAERLEYGEGTLVINLNGEPAADMLRYIAAMIEEGYTSGYNPRWTVTK